MSISIYVVFIIMAPKNNLVHIVKIGRHAQTY